MRSLSAPKGWLTDLARSDHQSYWEAGYPAVMITDTADLRNPTYHTPWDTPDRLDYRRMAMVVVALERAVQTLGDPRSNEGIWTQGPKNRVHK